MKAKLIQRISVRQSSESGVFRSVLWSWCFLGAIRGFPFFFQKVGCWDVLPRVFPLRKFWNILENLKMKTWNNKRTRNWHLTWKSSWFGFQPSIILAWSLIESAHAQEEWIIREMEIDLQKVEISDITFGHGVVWCFGDEFSFAKWCWLICSLDFWSHWWNQKHNRLDRTCLFSSQQKAISHYGVNSPVDWLPFFLFSLHVKARQSTFAKG